MFKKKTPQEKIIKFIEKNFSKELKGLFTANLLEKIELDWEKKLKPTIKGVTKWAGFPDLPKNIIWPENKDGKLDFLIQINLEQFENHIELLPKKGMLYIFVDLENLYSNDIINSEKIKVIYDEKTEGLIKSEIKKLSNQEEYELEIVKTYSILPFNSPKLEDFEMSDDEYDKWDELNFTLIGEYIGKEGYISIGQNINERVLYDWKNETEIENVDEYFSIFEIILDTLGYPDCWLEIGILKEDLKTLNFEKAILGLYGT